MMVRINLITPEKLADQHLMAEYNEILMLLGTIKKYPKIKSSILKYKLGEGYISFFKNKVLYLKKRHELLKKELIKRGFVVTKSIDLSEFPNVLLNDWNPEEDDYNIIKERLKEKLSLKPEFYTYYGEHKPLDFFIELLS